MGASRQGLLGDQVQTTATTSCHTMGAAEALGLTLLTRKKRAPVPGEPHSCTTVPVSRHPPLLPSPSGRACPVRTLSRQHTGN